ncbi:uncharacterized protein LOC122014730 isoform X1 [Zingiber officinale]|uniref:uncharacterized protein LOC122014730 isoform X1 n=1 Tax=Zingiber officinale TaxID=94328 RepID=UPI001C4B7247|nr:uncharacterized protein LOC122014730 isoform X1 [Zingiber officinale]
MNYVKKEQEGVKDIEFLSGFGMDGFVKPERDGPLEHSRSSPSEHSYTDEEALVDKRVEPEDSVSLLEKKIELEMTKKKGRKKPPKPPRPPNSLPLDATDQKLMKEIAHIARLKRERIARMKIKMKNKSTHSNSSLWALLVTILLVLVISWKGVYCRGSYILSLHDTPESSGQRTGGFVSIQFYKNVSTNPYFSSSASLSTLPILSVSQTMSNCTKLTNWHIFISHVTGSLYISQPGDLHAVSGCRR